MSFSSPSSDFVLLATTDASSSASVSFDGYFTSTYKNYKIIFSYVINATDGQYLYLRYRRSNADITSSNYRNVRDYGRSDSGGNYFASTGDDNLAYIGISTPDCDSTASAGGISGEMTIHNPLITTSYKWIRWEACQYNSDQTVWGQYNGTAVLKDSTAALSGLTFYFNSGNIASGNFKLYGIK